MINDQADHRVSACPVHFIWDGVGRGRMFVRWGFFGLILAFACLTLGRWLHLALVIEVSTVIFAVAGTTYILGQAISGALKLRRRAVAGG